jgi:hypothetical protein
VVQNCFGTKLIQYLLFKKKVFVFTFPKALLRPLPLRCTIHQVVAESECWSMCAKTAKNKKHATSQKSDGAT